MNREGRERERRKKKEEGRKKKGHHSSKHNNSQSTLLYHDHHGQLTTLYLPKSGSFERFLEITIENTFHWLKLISVLFYNLWILDKVDNLSRIARVDVWQMGSFRIEEYNKLVTYKLREVGQMVHTGNGKMEKVRMSDEQRISKNTTMRFCPSSTILLLVSPLLPYHCHHYYPTTATTATTATTGNTLD